MRGITLVTGGAGYLGARLVHDLVGAGHRVRVLDSLLHGGVPSLLPVWGASGFEFTRGDVRDPDVRVRALEGVDRVVHLAAIVGDPACARQPDEARSVNLDATVALLADARAAGVRRFVFASTCSNYGRLADASTAVTEEWDLSPVSLYAETKVAAEREVLARNAPELSTTCVRIATIYGVAPRMRFDLTVNEFVRDLWARDSLVVFGEQFWRPYVHVRDAAAGIATVLDAPPGSVAGEVFNLGATAENYRKLDLVDLLRSRFPDADVSFVVREEDPRDYRVSFDKIAKQLGFAPTRTVGSGIDEVIELLASGAVDDPFDPRFVN